MPLYFPGDYSRKVLNNVCGIIWNTRMMEKWISRQLCPIKRNSLYNLFNVFKSINGPRVESEVAGLFIFSYIRMMGYFRLMIAPKG